MCNAQHFFSYKMAQTINLTTNGDYIAVTGEHSTQEIEIKIVNTSNFDGGELQVWVGYFVNGVFQEKSLVKDTFGQAQTIKFATAYYIKANNQGQTWYALKLINAGANTNIEVSLTHNSNNIKTNKQIV